MEFVHSVQAQYDSGDSDFTATSILKPPQEIVLSERHPTLPVDVVQLLAATFGTSHHLTAETLMRAKEKEVRLFSHIEYGGKRFKISGQIDRIRNFDIEDMKFVGNWSINQGMKQEWVEQLNIQHWLAWRNGRQPERLWIRAINTEAKIPEIMEGRAKASADYEIPVWPHKQTEQFLFDKIEGVHKSRVRYTPCTPEQRWSSGEWAIQKPNAKRATKRFDTQEEALAANASGEYIITRDPKKNRRCQFYCPVAAVCQQWKQIRNG